MIARALALSLAAALPAAAETLDVNGHAVWYEVHGDLAAGTPILVLHGGMESTQMAFGRLIPRLSQSRAVIGLDQQGHGRTPDHDGPLTIAGMEADTLAVLDALHIRRAHVVGFSMGAMLGLGLAIDHPDRVASLTAISGSAGPEGMLPDIIRMNREPGFTPSPEVAALLPTEADFAAMAQGFAQNPSGPEVWQSTMAKAGALVGGDWGWSGEELGGITVPVQILIGDRDFILPDHARWEAAAIPGAWLGILTGETHMSILGSGVLPGMIESRIQAAEGAR